MDFPWIWRFLKIQKESFTTIWWDGDSLRLSTIGAARARNVRVGERAVGNQGSQDASLVRRSQQVADRLRHRARNVGFMQSKGRHIEVGADRLGDSAGELVFVQLHELHVREDADAVDASRKLVVVDIQLRQLVQAEKFAC